VRGKFSDSTSSGEIYLNKQKRERERDVARRLELPRTQFQEKTSEKNCVTFYGKLY